MKNKKVQKRETSKFVCKIYEYIGKREILLFICKIYEMSKLREEWGLSQKIIQIYKIIGVCDLFLKK